MELLLHRRLCIVFSIEGDECSKIINLKNECYESD